MILKNFYIGILYSCTSFIYYNSTRYGNDYGLLFYSTWNIFCSRIRYEDYWRWFSISCYSYNRSNKFEVLFQHIKKADLQRFLNPEADYAGNGYHLTQSLIGIGSGREYAQSRPSLKADAATGYAAQNVPEVHTDFIFSAIAEQLGL